ncbi:unnamed protein product, partial [Larinioides sclopetarius]
MNVQNKRKHASATGPPSPLWSLPCIRCNAKSMESPKP